MNYNNIYSKIIVKASKRSLSEAIYIEKHHIKPKCMGGGYNKNNIVILTGKEHFVCHHLLTKIYPNSLPIARAYYCMCNGLNGSFAIKARNRIKIHCTEEHKHKISIANKGKSKPVRSKEHCDNISKGKTGKPHIMSEDTYKKIALSNTGKKRSEAFCQNLSNKLKGRFVSADTKLKMSLARKNYLIKKDIM